MVRNRSKKSSGVLLNNLSAGTIRIEISIAVVGATRPWRRLNVEGHRVRMRCTVLRLFSRPTPLNRYYQ